MEDVANLKIVLLSCRDFPCTAWSPFVCCSPAKEMNTTFMRWVLLDPITIYAAEQNKTTLGRQLSARKKSSSKNFAQSASLNLWNSPSKTLHASKITSVSWFVQFSSRSSKASVCWALLSQAAMTIFLKEKLCHVIYKNVRARTRLSQRTLGKKLSIRCRGYEVRD